MATDPNWSPDEALAFISSDSRQIAVAATAQGVHLVWSQASTLFHTWRVHGAWQKPIKVATGEQPTVAASADGMLVCAYANWFLGNREIYVTTWDGATWSLPQLASRTSGESSDAAICMGPDGKVHLIWADTTPGYSTIYYAVRETAAWRNMPIPHGQGSRPTIAANDKMVSVAWQGRLAGSDSGSYDILAASLRDGEWSLPDIVSDTPTVHSILPHIALNAEGHCHLVWQEARSGLFVIRQSDRWPNGWTEPVDVSDPTADARLAFTAPNSKGMFQFLWAEGALIKHRVRHGAPQGVWWPPEVACVTHTSLSELAGVISPTDDILHTVFCTYANGAGRQFYHVQRRTVDQKKVLLPFIASDTTRN